MSGAQKPEAACVRATDFGKGRFVYVNAAVDAALRNDACRADLEAALAQPGFRRVTPENPQFRTVLREGNDGARDLWVCNTKSEEPAEGVITIQGRYAHAFDIVQPGWLPVPVTVEGDATRMTLRLDPGDWTVIRLVEP